MTGEGDPVPETRPPSPFLILLLGAAATALAAEWLRFGWGPWVAAGPAVVGATATILGVVRAFRRRRTWRERRKDAATTPGHGADRPLAPAPAAPETIHSVRSGEARLRAAGRPSTAPAAAATRDEAPTARPTARADRSDCTDDGDGPPHENGDGREASPRRHESAVR